MDLSLDYHVYRIDMEERRRDLDRFVRQLEQIARDGKDVTPSLLLELVRSLQ